jgi:hypothetical protein
MKNLNKSNLYWAVKTENGFIELGYNETSKKVVVQLLKEYLQRDTEILNYSEMTTKDFLRYVRYEMAERYSLKSSQTAFDWHIFE